VADKPKSGIEILDSLKPRERRRFELFGYRLWLSQRFCILKLANEIMLQIVLCL